MTYVIHVNNNSNNNNHHNSKRNNRDLAFSLVSSLEVGALSPKLSNHSLEYLLSLYIIVAIVTIFAIVAIVAVTAIIAILLVKSRFLLITRYYVTALRSLAKLRILWQTST
jgi:hypothetical protein